MTSASGKTSASTANRTIRIDADIAPRAALLAAAAARMGASDAAIEQVLTTHREAGVHLSDEELVNQMVEASQERPADRMTPVMPVVMDPGSAPEMSRETVPMAPPKSAPKKRSRRR